MKVLLFKTFIRPTLHYGIENFSVSSTTLIELRRVEGNFLKRIIDMPVRCHSTKLFAAMEIVETKLCVEKSKLSFFLRLLNNDLTKRVIEEEIKLKFLASHVEEIRVICNVSTEFTLESLVEAASTRLSEIIHVKRSLRDPFDDETIKIKSLLNNIDFNAKCEIFNLIKI
jgi:hypothetical protein